MTVTKKQPASAWRFAGVGAVGLALAVVAVAARHEPAASARTVELAPPAPVVPKDRIEREALARFAGAEPKVRLPDGRLLPPSNEAHALAIKVNAYRSILVKDEEARDPTFRLKAEAELARRAPRHVTIAWEDESGTRETVFTLDDSTGCGLEGAPGELALAPGEVARHPCLAERGENLWDDTTPLAVTLAPITADDAEWKELLRDTKKQMAVEAYLARTGGED